jgi:hypothetical protein
VGEDGGVGVGDGGGGGGGGDDDDDEGGFLHHRVAAEAAYGGVFDVVFGMFDAHLAVVRRRAEANRTRLNMACVVDQVAEDAGEASREAVKWTRLDTDRFVGDARLRCVEALLHEIDERGFERSNHQLKFHAAFLRACSRVLYREEWSVHRSAIMRHNEWDKVNSEVMVRIAGHTHSTLHTPHYALLLTAPVCRARRSQRLAGLERVRAAGSFRTRTEKEQSREGAARREARGASREARGASRWR